MKTPYAITLIHPVEVGESHCSDIRQPNEKYFWQSIVAIDPTVPACNNGMAKELVTIRWYHRNNSSMYYCCVWVSVPLRINGETLKGMQFAGKERVDLYTCGGAKHGLAFGYNAFHLSLRGAFRDAGIDYTRPDNAECDPSIEEYAGGIIKALFEDIARRGFDVPPYILHYAHA